MLIIRVVQLRHSHSRGVLFIVVDKVILDILPEFFSVDSGWQECDALLRVPQSEWAVETKLKRSGNVDTGSRSELL